MFELGEADIRKHRTLFRVQFMHLQILLNVHRRIHLRMPGVGSLIRSVPLIFPIPEQSPAHEQSQPFTTGFTMLLYNMCYLAHTQGVKNEATH
ncbi:hypothetical protein K503DRAFT_266168 [Rhizopogon vinicolor AM-OR11-026]|uniref:Uncharacterized protein n=1 Tax=Rhizopogon vinicolor AM-OR11-026 TaxID=1314800 RepID=A0A1B7MWI5_9AGAM|nr:hypothetical protein K503DRAFT_266168 [Rhizopogon vinicolor AM-OR11-026]